MQTFYIETYGCQMNKADSASMQENLIKSGFIPVNDPHDAGIIILNTCSVRKTAENRIWGRLGYYKSFKRKKELIILVAGCMAQRVGEEFFFANDAVDLVVGTFSRNQIPEILKNHQPGQRAAFIEEDKLAFTNSIPDQKNPKKAFVTISYGCNNFCSYCIVPYLRGRERSRPAADIIDDIKNLVDQGVKQVTLLGQNVNSYGNDLGNITFAGLLKKICRKTDIQWIKYLSSHPKDFTDELIDVIRTEDKVAKCVHLAVQSGSNHVLQLMNRHYTVESYRRIAEKLKLYMPKLNLTTDIIVGFPGETAVDYQATVELVKQIEFNDAFMYKYNIRDHTYAAAHLTDDVPDQEKNRRLSEIIELQRQIVRKRKLERINDIFEVLPETWSRQSTREILGLTKEDLMIIFQGDAADFQQIIKVKALRLEGNTLFGEKLTTGKKI